jgi:hypothetical protein
MTRKEAEARTEFENILLQSNSKPVAAGGMPARDAARLLMRHGRTYARIQEAICNGVGTWHGESNESFGKRQARHEAWTEKREQQLERRIREICAALGPGFEPVFNGDPRGATVKIRVPSGRTNDWGGIGICVPTS